MNERIKLLAEQADLYARSDNSSMVFENYLNRYTEKLAELIIAECIATVERTPTHCAFTTYDYPTVTCTISKSVEILKTEFGLPL